jgi:hypothetical protein
MENCDIGHKGTNLHWGEKRERLMRVRLILGR